MLISWECHLNIAQMNAIGHHWWYVIIGSGNGLVPDGTKPLPAPMLFKFNVAIWCHQGWWVEPYGYDADNLPWCVTWYYKGSDEVGIITSSLPLTLAMLLDFVGSHYWLSNIIRSKAMMPTHWLLRVLEENLCIVTYWCHIVTQIWFNINPDNGLLPDGSRQPSDKPAKW